MADPGRGDRGGRDPAQSFTEIELPAPHPLRLAVLASIVSLALPAATAIAVAGVLGPPRVPHSSGAAIASAVVLTLVEALLAGLVVGVLVEAAWRRWNLPGLGPANFLPIRWARHRWAHRRVRVLLKRLGTMPVGPEAIPVISELAGNVARMNVYRRTHPGRASHLAAELGHEVGLSPAECETARLSALLKNVGTLDLPFSLMDRPGPIDPEEAETIHLHQELGAELIAPYVGAEVASVVRQHPEAVGTATSEHPATAGPSVAGVVAAVDAYDALLSDRAYRVGRSKEAAFAELVAASGSQLDPFVVKSLIDLERGKRSWPWLPAFSPVAAFLRRAEHVSHVSPEPGAAAVTAMVMGAAAWFGLWTGAIHIAPTTLIQKVIGQSSNPHTTVNEGFAPDSPTRANPLRDPTGNQSQKQSKLGGPGQVDGLQARAWGNGAPASGLSGGPASSNTSGPARPGIVGGPTPPATTLPASPIAPAPPPKSPAPPAAPKPAPSQPPPSPHQPVQPPAPPHDVQPPTTQPPPAAPPPPDVQPPAPPPPPPTTQPPPAPPPPPPTTQPPPAPPPPPPAGPPSHPPHPPHP